MLSKVAKGIEIESLVADYLQKQNVLVLFRNFRCRLGEIDLICQQNKTLAFIEVRFRSSTYFGSAAESVTVSKQRKLIRAAHYFLQQHPQFAKNACRFDVMAVTLENQKPRIDWIPNAFIETGG